MPRPVGAVKRETSLYSSMYVLQVFLSYLHISRPEIRSNRVVCGSLMQR